MGDDLTTSTKSLVAHSQKLYDTAVLAKPKFREMRTVLTPPRPVVSRGKNNISGFNFTDRFVKAGKSG